MRPWRGEKTAFSLSGGGARGALQVGCLRALAEHRIVPDFIVGTSVGAWNGAWVASGLTPERVRQLAAIWGTISRTSFRMAWWRAARNYTLRRTALYDGEGLARLIARHLQAHRFEDLAIPLYAISVNISRGVKAVLSQGPLAPAVLASSAIPGIFPPVLIKGEQHVDGGMADPASLETALELGATRVYVLDSGYHGVVDGAIASMEGIVEHAVQVGAYLRIREAIERARRHAEVIWLRPNSGFQRHSMDFRFTAQYLDDGYRFTADRVNGTAPARRRFVLSKLRRAPVAP
jgi:NTE family protein